MLATLLVSIAIATVLQSTAKPEPAAKQETPRALIERAAYAAEHERDFDAAATLYAKAAELAKAQGDAKTAEEARLAQQRVLARQGKAAAPEQPVDAAIVDRAALLVALASGMTSHEAYASSLGDIALFGPMVVPWLEQVLIGTSSVEFEGYRASSNPPFAAHALAQIELPEAGAALSRGLDSRDPIVRRAVVVAADGDRHRDLLVRAVRDPVSAVREQARNKLMGSQDSALYPVFEELARGGDEAALSWLCQVEPAALVERLGSADLDDAFRARALDQLASRVPHQRELPAVAMTDAAFEIARAAKDEAIRKAAHGFVGALFARLANDSDDSRARRAAFEERALRFVESEPSARAIGWLSRVAGFATLRALPAISDRVAASNDDAALESIANLVAFVKEAQVSPEVFAAWLAFYRHMPPAVAERVQTNGRTVREYVAERLGMAATRGEPPSLEAVCAGLEGLEGTALKLYVPVVQQRVELAMGGPVRTAQEVELPASVTPALRALIAHGNERARMTAVAALDSVDDPALIDLALDAVADRTLQGRADNAGRHLAGLDPSHAARAIQARIEPLLAKSGFVGADSSVTDSIGWLPAPQALDLFRSAWPKATSEDARNALLWVLTVRISGAEATAELLAHYGDIPGGQAHTRKRAIERFASELYEPAIPVLGEALRDASEYVREAARAASLAFKQQREALEEFSAWTKASDEARQSIAELVQLLESPNRDVALGAVHALAALRARSALPALVKLLARDDAVLKAAVQDAIGKIGQ